MSEGEADGRVIAEVAHEAFLRAWPRLAQWLREERDFLIFKGEAERAERRWREMREPDKALLSGLDLARAEEWFPKRLEDFSAEVVAYARRSIAADGAQKEQRLRFSVAYSKARSRRRSYFPQRPYLPDGNTLWPTGRSKRQLRNAIRSKRNAITPRINEIRLRPPKLAL